MAQTISFPHYAGIAERCAALQQQAKERLDQFSMFLQTRRHRRFVSFFTLPPSARVLDISCGGGDVCGILHRYTSGNTFTGIDMQESCIDAARKDFSWGAFAVARAEALPFGDASFDALVSCMAFHHYQDPESVLREASRVLTPGGVLHIIDRMPLNRLSQFFRNKEGCGESYHFEQYYRASELTAFAERFGFSLESNRRIRPLSDIRVSVFRKIS